MMVVRTTYPFISFSFLTLSKPCWTLLIASSPALTRRVSPIVPTVSNVLQQPTVSTNLKINTSGILGALCQHGSLSYWSVGKRGTLCSLTSCQKPGTSVRVISWSISHQSFVTCEAFETCFSCPIQKGYKYPCNASHLLIGCYVPLKTKIRSNKCALHSKALNSASLKHGKLLPHTDKDSADVLKTRNPKVHTTNQSSRSMPVIWISGLMSCASMCLVHRLCWALCCSPQHRRVPAPVACFVNL